MNLLSDKVKFALQFLTIYYDVIENQTKTHQPSAYEGMYKQLLAGLSMETESALTWSENHNVIWINGRPYMFNPRNRFIDKTIYTMWYNRESTGNRTYRGFTSHEAF